MADISKAELRKEITAILEDADLNTMSAKRVRTLLEEQLEIDLTARKKEVDDLVMKCLKEQQDRLKPGNGAKKDKEDDEESEEEEEEEEEEDEDDKPKVKRAAKKPTNKRKKAASDSEDGSGDEDASDDDYSPAKKGKGSAKKGKAGKKKATKGSSDDDDEDWNKSKKKAGGGSVKKAAGGAKKPAAGGAKKGGGYTKAYSLTPELAAVVGQEEMARHEVVKKVWAIIKERNLYDPKNKQFAICDDELLKVFGVKRFRTFGMMKYLKNHFVTK